MEDRGWAGGMKVDGRNGGIENPGGAEGLEGPGIAARLKVCGVARVTSRQSQKDKGPVIIWW